MKRPNVELGCGLAGIGLPSGAHPNSVPTERQAFDFLNTAMELGVPFFATSPSFNTSEERLGKMLQEASGSERRNITVATKIGCDWDPETGETYADFTGYSLIRSIDRSIERLGGKLDVLVVDNPEASMLMRSEQPLIQSLEYAQRQYGIAEFGISVDNIGMVQLALGMGSFRHIQLAYNKQREEFAPYIDSASEHEKQIIISSPLQSGSIEQGANQYDKGRYERHAAAFGFILERTFEGIVLTDASTPDHLQDDLAAFWAIQA